MAFKKSITSAPVGYIVDKKGKKIAVFRAGMVDQNKYARKTPLEKHIEAQIGKKDFEPPPPDPVEPQGGMK